MMTEKGKLETVPEDPELSTTPKDGQTDVARDSDQQTKGENVLKTVVVDIQLPIVTDVGQSQNTTRENSANIQDGNTSNLKDENNNQESFMEKVSEKLASSDANDTLYGAFTRTDTILSKVSSVRIPSPTRQSARKSKSAQKFPKLKSSNCFTKKDLELFLPKKTFYSAHDKALKEAGHHIDSTEQRKKPNWRAILKMHSMEELYPPDKKPDEVVQVQAEADSEEEEDPEGFLLENVNTAMSGGAGSAGGASSGGTSTHAHKPKRSKKKQLSNEKEEYKQLYDYLKYIQEHPDEYKAMSKYTPKNNDYRHPNTMVRMGRAYRRWHHGVQKHSMFQHAVNGLKTTPEPETKRGHVTRRDVDGDDQTAVQEESEIEKLKCKTEKWLSALPTHQILKVKELALKDIGDEDASTSKWWITFRNCHYVRLPQHLNSN